MPGPVGAAQVIAQGVHVHPGPVRPQRVDFFHRRGERHGHSGVAQLGAVRVQGARIGVEVLIGTELGGVDENRHHHLVAVALGLAHQTQVPVMQVAHGGHEAHPLSGLAPLAHALAHLGDGMQQFHGDQKQCCLAGNWPSLTARS